jgi:hypothetical protein
VQVLEIDPVLTKLSQKCGNTGFIALGVEGVDE